MDHGFDIRCRRGHSLGGHEYNACRGDLGRYGMVEALLKRSELIEGSMYTLYHHPFCPHSRFVRLVLGEYGLDLRLVEERAWERREDFLALNTAGSTPVLTVDGLPPFPGVSVIAEFIDDACG